jgi:hypothetical protein
MNWHKTIRAFSTTSEELKGQKKLPSGNGLRDADISFDERSSSIGISPR